MPYIRLPQVIIGVSSSVSIKIPNRWAPPDFEAFGVLGFSCFTKNVLSKRREDDVVDDGVDMPLGVPTKHLIIQYIKIQNVMGF